MFEFIEKLRQKSDKTKNRIAFLTAFAFSGLIFVLWLTVFLPDFTQGEKQENQALVGEPSPLSTFFDTISEGVKVITQQFSELKQTTGEITGTIGQMIEPTTTPAVETTATSSTEIATTTEEN